MHGTVDKLAGSDSVLAIIPARGGSKGLARKNLKLLGGHPLLSWSIAAARAARMIDRVVVTTDDLEIAEVARRYGGDVPFIRPAELAQDDTPDLPVFQHTLRWLSEHQGYRPAIVVHLRPTTPFRRPADIDRALSLLQARPEADSVRSVVRPFQNPFKMWRPRQDGLLEPLLPLVTGESYNMPRQQLPEVRWHNGYLDVIRRRTILDLGSMCGRLVLPLEGEEHDWVDIDGQDILDYAEHLLQSGRVRIPIPQESCPASPMSRTGLANPSAEEPNA